MIKALFVAAALLATWGLAQVLGGPSHPNQGCQPAGCAQHSAIVKLIG